MSIKVTAVAALLIDIEEELRTLGLWQVGRPGEEALASVQPFCLDTLTFHQWLQFIFIEKIRFMLEQSIPLPSSCAISAMGEEYYRGATFNVGRLLSLLKTLDTVITSA